MSAVLVKWCSEHDDVALVYDDGSVSCRWELVVEARTGDHTLVELPEMAAERERSGALAEALRIADEALRLNGHATSGVAMSARSVTAHALAVYENPAPVATEATQEEDGR